jgi:hypothetical protein
MEATPDRFVRPFRLIAFSGVAFCASLLMPVAARAQIGGSGWSSATVSYKVQWPYNVAEDTRFWATNNIYHCLVYSNDAPFEQGSTTLPRTEMRFEPDFTGGEMQYQATLMVPGNENSYCIMQDHTGDAQSDQYGPVAIMFIWLSKDGGSVWNGYTGDELGKNLGGKWFTLNVDHNVVTHKIRAWINGLQVVYESDNGATDYYFKNGVYEQNLGKATLQMDTYVTNILMWTNTGEFTGSGTYEIENAYSGLALNVAGGATTNNAEVVQYPFDGSANSLWTFSATSNGYYQVINVNSAKDAVVAHASTTNGAPIIQYSFGSSGDDQWKPVENNDGSYTLTDLKSGKVLEDPGSSKSQGTQMDQYSANGGTNQEWFFIGQ